MITIWIDNDACPGRIREIIFRAGERLSLPIKLVSNSYTNRMGSSRIEWIVVGREFDAADNYIAAQVNDGDLVITGDIPLADRVITKGAIALTPRGLLLDASNVKDTLSVRNLSQELRSAGEISGGPKKMDGFDINKFASAFDKILTKMMGSLKAKN